MKILWEAETSGSVFLSSHLRAPDTDDAVHTPVGIVEKRDSDSMLAGREPVPLCGRVNLEDMRSGTEDGLLP